MQNWLAPSDPDLFFGVPGGRPLPRPGADSGAIVFSQRLMVGELVEVINGEHYGQRGVVAGADADTTQPYVVELRVQAPAHEHEDELAQITFLAKAPASDGEAEGEGPQSDPTNNGPIDVSNEKESLHQQEASRALELHLPPATEPPIELTTVQLWPNELRRSAPDEKQLARGVESNGMRVLESCIRWTPRIAGRLCELPTRGVTAHGDVLTLEEPIRFWCPREPLWAAFVVQASLRCTVYEISFSHVKLAPWSAFDQHWMQEDGGGLVSSHHEPLIRTRVVDFKPHYGSDRKEIRKELPMLFARLVNDANGYSRGKRLIQSSDGTVTQTCQCSNDTFDAVRSVHSIRFEGSPKLDTFTLRIVRCANERAAGLRIGVCSADGRKAWMLRLSDCRLCGANGSPAPGAKSLMDNWASLLPPSLMSYNVIVTVEMGDRPSRRKLYFCLQDCGGPKFEAHVGLPSVVHPCVHLTHKGDAMRLEGHTTIKIRTPGENSPTRPGGASPKASARYLTWSPARYRREQEETHAFTRSLRTLRPQSPSASPTSSPRPGSPSGRRRRQPQSAEVFSVKTASAKDVAGDFEPALMTWTAASPPSGVTCAHCHAVPTDGTSPWCNKCRPRTNSDR